MDQLLLSSPRVRTHWRPFHILPGRDCFRVVNFGFKQRKPGSVSYFSCNRNGGSSLKAYPILDLSDELNRNFSSREIACSQSISSGESANEEATMSLLQKVTSTLPLILISTVSVISFESILASPAYGTVIPRVHGGVLNIGLLSSAWTGFIAGCLHTLSGPDHLAALAPLSIGRSSVECAAAGALWGCGHDAGQVLFDLLFLLLKDRLHIEILSTWGTRIVGLTLIIIGFMGIREAVEASVPCIAVENGQCVVESAESQYNGKRKVGFTTFATGIIHGLQPDAMMMILPAMALPSRIAGAAFLGMFLIGTVFAMGSYTIFIGRCSQALKERIPRVTEKLTWASSSIAIALGVSILISQFFGLNLY